MIKIENIIVPNGNELKFIIQGMRNPMNSWDKTDSGFCSEINDIDMSENPSIERACDHCPSGNGRECTDYLLGKNDLDLAIRLSDNGPVHSKYKRMMNVYLRITAPLYWWKEFDTYKVGTVANSCSTMHKIQSKEFTEKDFSTEHLLHDELIPNTSVCPKIYLSKTIDILNYYRDRYNSTGDKRYWWQLIQLLPSSYNQTRNVMVNYEVLDNIYQFRKNHKLDEWREFCKMIENDIPYSKWLIVKK